MEIRTGQEDGIQSIEWMLQENGKLYVNYIHVIHVIPGGTIYNLFDKDPLCLHLRIRILVRIEYG